jgi:DNA-binding transcriptional MocR family regulator
VAQRIEVGELTPGDLAPATADLAAEHDVSVATAGRAVALLKEWGLLTAAGRGRAHIARRAAPLAELAVEVDDGASTEQLAGGSAGFCSVTLRGPDGRRYPGRLVPGSLADPAAFRAHLLGIARIEAPERTDEGEAWIGLFELDVVEIGADRPPVTLRW